MDFTQQIENIKQQLLSLGFTEEKYNELLNLAAEEMMDNALETLQEKDLEELQNLESQLIPEVSTPEEANKNIALIFTAAYGDKAEEMRQKMLLDYLNITVEQTKSTKDLLERYNAGDPTAIAAVEAQKDNPDVQEFVKYMEENNATSTDDALSPFPQQTSH
ncbi:MAG: hypothetical protein ACOX0R_02870 [Candidatus Dojkabacteria bacterium]|jgi:reverse gyrase